MTTIAAPEAKARATWRAVAMPDEHGGWAITAEPALLGLLVAPSWAGGLLAIAAMLAFVARTPLKVVLVDRWRHRWLPRSQLALRIAAVELTLLAGLVALTVTLAGWRWIVPVLIAVPLVAVELWFDMRSRSRRLVPELCGAVGISAAAASIALAGGADARLAVALWVLLSGRVITSIPFVRTQIGRLRHGPVSVASSDLAQAVGIAVAAVAVFADPAVLAGAIAVIAFACLQLVWVRRPPVPAKRLGLRLLFLGLAVVGITAVGVHLT